MAAPIPEPGPDEEQPPRDTLGPEAGQPPADAPGLGAGQQTPDGRGPDSGQAQDCWRGPGWAWVEGSADSGPVASWGQACELAAVARIAARAAAADRRIGLDADGRPARVSRDAVGQVEMALRLTHYGAEARADLAVTLAWRLRATGAALAAGRIDGYRAQLIAEATSVLPEDLAPRGGGQPPPPTAPRARARRPAPAPPPGAAGPAAAAPPATAPPPAGGPTAGGRGMTCPPRAMRTPRPATAPIPNPAPAAPVPPTTTAAAN